MVSKARGMGGLKKKLGGVKRKLKGKRKAVGTALGEDSVMDFLAQFRQQAQQLPTRAGAGVVQRGVGRGAGAIRRGAGRAGGAFRGLFGMGR